MSKGYRQVQVQCTAISDWNAVTAVQWEISHVLHYLFPFLLWSWDACREPEQLLAGITHGEQQSLSAGSLEWLWLGLAWPGPASPLLREIKRIYTCARQEGKALLLWFGGDFLPLCLGARNQEGTVLEWGKPADFSSGSLQHESDVSTSANAQCAAYQPVRQCWLIAGNAHRMPGISQGALQWYFKNKRWLACDKYFYRSGNDKIQGIPKEQTGSLWCWTNRN